MLFLPLLGKEKGKWGHEDRVFILRSLPFKDPRERRVLATPYSMPEVGGLASFSVYRTYFSLLYLPRPTVATPSALTLLHPQAHLLSHPKYTVTVEKTLCHILHSYYFEPQSCLSSGSVSTECPTPSLLPSLALGFFTTVGFLSVSAS